MATYPYAANIQLTKQQQKTKQVLFHQFCYGMHRMKSDPHMLISSSFLHSKTKGPVFSLFPYARELNTDLEV